MSYLEELLPEFRKGAKIRLAHWNKGKFIVLKEDAIVDNANYEYPLSIPETLSNQWEFYQEPIDWDYIIKNKCLCWFWDKREDYKMMGTLEKYASLSNISRFIANVYGEENGFCNCLPVRRDEVNFYEDEKE